MYEVVTARADYLNIYVNSFIVSTQRFNIFIDSGIAGNIKSLQPYVENGKTNVLLMTHGHWDHIGLNSYIRKHGGMIYAHKADIRFYQDFDWHWKYGFGQFENDIIVPPERQDIFWNSIGKPTPIDRFVREGDELTFDEVRLKVVELPGHSLGSIGYVDEDHHVLFSGDALMGKGFFGGMAQYCDYEKYIRSMQKIIEIKPEKVYTSHTDCLDYGKGIETARDAIAFAHRVKSHVETYIASSDGKENIVLGEIGRYVAAKVNRAMGGGACVTVLNHLFDMKNNDSRIEKCVGRYICKV